MYKLFSWYSKILGWRFDQSIPIETYSRSVIIACPHTSNWDFVHAMAAFNYMKVPVRFTIKKEWMRFPVKRMMQTMGALPIDRRPKQGLNKRESTVEAMIRLYDEHKKICLIITPEGTRSKREKWKSGFYHVALGAKVPIALGYADYEKKMVGVGKIVYPTGDIKKDMSVIMDFYQKIAAKYPDQYSPDLRYV